MERLRDCIEGTVKFTLDYRTDFDLGLADDFCSGLLSGDPLLPADTVEEALAGVPDFPLYKPLALSLMKSVASGCFCGSFEKISLVKEVTWLKETKDEWSKLIAQKGFELVNALKDIACELHVQEPLFSLMKDGIKTVEARCFEAGYDRLQQRSSTVMINKCLIFEVLEVHQFASFYELLKAESPEKVFPGFKTVEEGLELHRGAKPSGSFSHYWIHCSCSASSKIDSTLFIHASIYTKGCRLSHGARALAKHVDRSSDRFWGVLHGTDSDKNRLAMDIIDRFIGHCCWMNIHIVPPHGEVFEIRVAQGYGARWSRDGTKFIGFLEPYTEDGHSMAWMH